MADETKAPDNNPTVPEAPEKPGLLDSAAPIIHEGPAEIPRLPASDNYPTSI